MDTSETGLEKIITDWLHYHTQYRTEEKTEFVQTYFANPDFQNFVNARVFQAAVSQLSDSMI